MIHLNEAALCLYLYLQLLTFLVNINKCSLLINLFFLFNTQQRPSTKHFTKSQVSCLYPIITYQMYDCGVFTASIRGAVQLGYF